jgi:hypothetical protein
MGADAAGLVASTTSARKDISSAKQELTKVNAKQAVVIIFIGDIDRTFSRFKKLSTDQGTPRSV